MAVGRERPIEMTRGDYQTISGTIVGIDGSTPVDLTNYTTIKFQVFTNSSGAPVGSDKLGTPKVLASGIVVATPANGQFVVTLDSVDTKDIPAGLYWYELEITETNESPIRPNTPIFGPFTLKQHGILNG